MNRVLLSVALASLGLLAGCAGKNEEAVGSGAGAASAPIAPDDPCHTDGCVMRKHDQLAAVMKWVEGNDECTSVVAWTQKIELIGLQTYAVVCGDSDATEFRLHVEGGGAAAAVVTKIGEAKAKAVTVEHCHTDGCVIRKGQAFSAAMKWTATNDECSSVVSWVQSIAETGEEGDFLVKCGDTSDSETITLTTSTTQNGDVVATRKPAPAKKR